MEMKFNNPENWEAQAQALGENDGPRHQEARLSEDRRPPGYIFCLLEINGIATGWRHAAGFRPQLRADGLVDENNLITPRGRAYIDMLCNTPLPVMLWADPREAK